MLLNPKEISPLFYSYLISVVTTGNQSQTLYPLVYCNPSLQCRQTEQLQWKKAYQLKVAHLALGKALPERFSRDPTLNMKRPPGLKRLCNTAWLQHPRTWYFAQIWCVQPEHSSPGDKMGIRNTHCTN